MAPNRDRHELGVCVTEQAGHSAGAGGRAGLGPDPEEPTLRRRVTVAGSRANGLGRALSERERPPSPSGTERKGPLRAGPVRAECSSPGQHRPVA